MDGDGTIDIVLDDDSNIIDEVDLDGDTVIDTVFGDDFSSSSLHEGIENVEVHFEGTNDDLLNIQQSLATRNLPVQIGFGSRGTQINAPLSQEGHIIQVQDADALKAINDALEKTGGDAWVKVTIDGVPDFISLEDA